MIYENLNPIWSGSILFEMLAFLCGGFIIGYWLRVFLKKPDKTVPSPCNFKQDHQNKLSALETELRILKNTVRDIRGDLTRIDNHNLRQDEQIAKQFLPHIPHFKRHIPADSEAASLEKTKPIVSELSIKDISYSEADKDDLKLIKGIGPLVERKINALGIFTFRQMSELKPADLQKISQKIAFFPNRIEREAWIEQAKALRQSPRAKATTIRSNT